MKQEAGLDKHLRMLNELLVKERNAITQLQMQRLATIQREKTAILKKVAESEKCADPECLEMAARIQENNRRNRWLLRSGLHLIDKLQQDVHRRLALTYAPHGRALHIDAGPRILNQRS
jgi:hypothetical protein